MSRDARKMLFDLIIFCLVLQISGTNICNSGSCLCGYKHNTNQDFAGETIKCTFSDVNILDNIEYNLPVFVYSIDLSSNNITDLRSSKLLQSKTLIELFLNKNRIEVINTQVLKLPELKRLDLSDNLLEFIDKDAFKDVKKLEYLNLANNKFTTFIKLAFHHLSNLNEIVLDYNNIGPHLKDSNLFDRNGFGLTDKINSVSIKGINLNKVPDNFFVDAFDIRKLVISNNNISDIFEIPYTLEYLDLSDNPITEISGEDFTDLPALRVLKLNNLQVKEVPEYAFASLHSLSILELERNGNLTMFDSLAFGKDVLDDADDFLLERLSLKGSRLTSLDIELLEPFGQLIELDLQGNPWRCDCNIVWIKKLQISEYYYNHLRCAAPPSLFNARIFDLKSKYFVCVQHHVGASIALVTFALLLSGIAIGIFFYVPKFNSRCTVLRDMYTPSTAYSVLPMATSIHIQRD